MEQMKEYDEVWAVESQPVKDFFKELGGDVTVIPLPDKKMGALSLPQTRIIIKGNDAEELYRQFFIQFMRAGG